MGLHVRIHSLFILIPAAILSSTLHAQYLGLNLRGDVGIKGGSQPDPGFYFLTPLYYRNDYTGIRGAQGNQILPGAEFKINVFTTPAVAVTTPFKILGGTYGFQVVPLVLNQRLDVAAASVKATNGYGFADMFVEPISLGWRKTRADYSVGYGFFAPTGGDRSLDMWGHEITGGTTVYLDHAKKMHASALASYDIYQKKSSADITVGNILTVEGGAGYSFLKGAGSAGLSYVGQWKITDDKGTGIPPVLPITKGRVFGLGPEITMPVFARGTTVALLSFRYQWEFGARTNFEGRNLIATLTIAHIMPGPH